MELKHKDELKKVTKQLGLNRTFYGIETGTGVQRLGLIRVLIVPFMELKPASAIL